MNDEEAISAIEVLGKHVHRTKSPSIAHRAFFILHFIRAPLPASMRTTRRIRQLETE